MQIGVVLFFLGDAGDVVEEGHCGEEVFHDPLLADAFAVVDQGPAGEGGKLCLGFGQGVFGDAPFAGDALFGGEFEGGKGGHGGDWTEVRGETSGIIAGLLRTGNRRVRLSDGGGQAIAVDGGGAGENALGLGAVQQFLQPLEVAIEGSGGPEGGVFADRLEGAFNGVGGVGDGIDRHDHGGAFDRVEGAEGAVERFAIDRPLGGGGADFLQDGCERKQLGMEGGPQPPIERRVDGE